MGGARLAAEHLLALGRRRVAHITGEEGYRAARDRAAGLLRVLDEAGLALAAYRPLYGAWSQRWGRQAARMLLAAHPGVDAVFCGSDQIASGVIDALHDLGRRVPDDIAVVGYDNWEIFATESRPPLTTVDLDLERLGGTAARQLIAALEGERGAASSGIRAASSSASRRAPCRADQAGPVLARSEIGGVSSWWRRRRRGADSLQQQVDGDAPQLARGDVGGGQRGRHRLGPPAAHDAGDRHVARDLAPGAPEPR